MTAEQLRTVREAVPFRPFTITMAGGRTHRVHHRDYLSVSPSGRTAVVYRDDDANTFLDILLITEISIDPTPASVSSPADTVA
jgi:hypothetical protein